MSKEKYEKKLVEIENLLKRTEVAFNQLLGQKVLLEEFLKEEPKENKDGK